MTRILGLITASILMAGLLGAPKTAQAETGDMGIDVNLFSYHLERCFSNCTREFNEVNAGLTYTYQAHDHAEILVGFLKNSFAHPHPSIANPCKRSSLLFSTTTTAAHNNMSGVAPGVVALILDGSCDYFQKGLVAEAGRSGWR